MSLRTFVKINGVNNLSDARYCAGMSVDLIGFDINEVTPEVFQEITSWVSGVDFVIETDKLDGITSYKVNNVESSDTKVLTAQDDSIKTIFNTSIETITDEDLKSMDYVLVNGPENLNSSQLSAIKALSKQNKVLLGCGFNADNVNDIIDETGVHGIAISAGDEIRPGFKDYDELADILEALEVDEWA